MSPTNFQYRSSGWHEKYVYTTKTSQAITRVIAEPTGRPRPTDRTNSYFPCVCRYILYLDVCVCMYINK